MKKIFTSVLLLAIGALVIPYAVNAGTVPVTGTGERTQDATVAGITTTDTYDVELEWGALSYTFKKGAGDTYTWEPTSEGSNVVRVSNRQSTTKITASIAWESAIDGVTASMLGKKSNGTTVCNLVGDENQPFQWANAETGSYVLHEDFNDKFYTAGCTTEVEVGTVYAANNFYRKELHQEDLNETLVNLDYQTGEGPEAITQSAGWEVNLTGGNLANVQTAYATAEKTIGTVTVTIAKFQETT